MATAYYARAVPLRSLLRRELRQWARWGYARPYDE